MRPSSLLVYRKLISLRKNKCVISAKNNEKNFRLKNNVLLSVLIASRRRRLGGFFFLRRSKNTQSRRKESSSSINKAGQGRWLMTTFRVQRMAHALFLFLS